MKRNAAGDIPEGLKKKKQKSDASDAESDEPGTVKEADSEADKGSEDEPETPKKKPKEKDLFSSFLDTGDEESEILFPDFEEVPFYPPFILPTSIIT